jgi:hypothetical protein
LQQIAEITSRLFGASTAADVNAAHNHLGSDIRSGDDGLRLSVSSGLSKLRGIPL